MWIEKKKKQKSHRVRTKRQQQKMCNVCLARSQQITVTTNTNINRHPLTKWIIERRQSWRGEQYPHENNKLYRKSVWQLRKENGNVGQSFSDSFPYHCVLWTAGGPLGNRMPYRPNDGGKLIRMTHEWRQLLWEILASSLRLGGNVAVRVNKIPLNLIDKSESSQERQRHNDCEDWRRRLRWVFPFLAFIFAIVFKVYNLPTNAAIGSFLSCKMDRKQYPFS